MSECKGNNLGLKGEDKQKKEKKETEEEKEEEEKLREKCLSLYKELSVLLSPNDQMYNSMQKIVTKFRMEHEQPLYRHPFDVAWNIIFLIHKDGYTFSEKMKTTIEAYNMMKKGINNFVYMAPEIWNDLWNRFALLLQRVEIIYPSRAEDFKNIFNNQNLTRFE